MYGVNGRVVVITGATGGLGNGLAVELRKRGAKLALFGRKESILAEQVQALGGEEYAKHWVVDVVDYQGLEAAMKQVEEYFGRIDVVIANAGVELFGPVEDTDPAAFDQLINVNLNGVFRTLKAAIPFVRKHQGYFAIISSMAAFAHSPMQAAYTASKAALIAFANSLRLELRQDQIGVGTFHPGFFQTPLLEGDLEQPASLELFCNFKPGTLFVKKPIEGVVNSIVNGIEHRNMVTMNPPFLYMVALAAGIWRFIFEYLGFRENVENSLDLWRKDHPRKSNP